MSSYESLALRLSHSLLTNVIIIVIVIIIIVVVVVVVVVVIIIIIIIIQTFNIEGIHIISSPFYRVLYNY
jgi:hypothetical protein